jgi:hypothetical protein
VTNEDLLRTGALVAAAALLAAPYWEQIARLGSQAAESAKQHGAGIARIAAAALIVAAAWGAIPIPSLPPAVPSVSVEKPSMVLQSLVEPVGRALAKLPASDRMLWASVWKKSALVVADDGVRETAVFTETGSLRLFTIITLDIAWRRIGGHAPGSVPGLREAVESAMKSAIGDDSTAVTPEIRAKYAEVAAAIAWAGIYTE